MRPEIEFKRRQSMINVIEGHVGIWKVVWNEWPTDQIEKLYEWVITHGSD